MLLEQNHKEQEYTTLSEEEQKTFSFSLVKFE